MKSAIIFYFSGTGNTELVAVMLKDELEKRQYQAELIRMEDVLKKKTPLNLGRYDLVGIGSQVIGFATPTLVNKFVRMLPEAQGKKAFVFRTAGGVAPVNYNASKPMIHKLSRKGYDVFYERIFSIGSNWITKFDDGIIVRLHEAARKKAGLMCDELVLGKKRFLKTGFFQKVLMGCVMRITPLFFRIAGKDYAVNESCTHCGLCVKNCPAGNIVEKNGKMTFKMSCNLCMRCVYSCPRNAIHFRKLNFFAVPGGYNIKKILAQPCPGENGSAKPEPPFLKSYLADDAL
jgi:ferredoxin/flavodoxin